MMSPFVYPLPCFEENEAWALFDGAAYAEMTAMLSRARSSIRMEFFLFGGRMANALIDILAQKKAAGVCVQVTLDSTRDLHPEHRRERDAAQARMRVLGLDVISSDPRPFPHSPSRRAMSHNKFIVVDDREALIGGMNVGQMFSRFHDVMIHLIGPTAAALGHQFDHDRRCAASVEGLWPRGLIEKLPAADQTAHAPGRTRARILGTGIGRRTVELALLANIGAARSSIRVALSEMGRTAVLKALIAAATQGLSVRVLLCPLNTAHYLPDHLGFLSRFAPSGTLNAFAVRALLRAGIPVHLYRVTPEFSMMHLKMSLFDDTAAIVGSTNWTQAGFHWVGETDVEMRGGDVFTQLAAQFEADWRRSVPAGPPSVLTHFLYTLYALSTQRAKS